MQALLMNHWIEGIGYLGTLLTLGTYSMKTMVRLRAFGIAAGDLDGRVLDEVGGTWDLAALRGAVASLDGDSFTVNSLPARFAPPNGAPRPLSLSGRVLRSIDAPNTRLLLLGFADGVAPKSVA